MEVPLIPDAEHNQLDGNIENQPPIANDNRGPNLAQPQNPLFGMRDRLFQALFYRISLTYARAFPQPVRRFIEFALLLKVCKIFYYFSKSILYIIVYAHIHLLYIHSYIHTYIHICISIYKYMRTDTCMYMCLYIVYVYMYVFIYIYIYICLYIYIHLERKNRPCLVEFRDSLIKNAVMESLSNLANADEKYKKLSVAHDMTKLEREDLKKLLAEAKVKESDTGQGE